MLQTYAELQQALSALPPPAPGTTRVYRGQTTHYPTLTPTGLRDPGVSDFRLWHLSQTFLVDRVRHRPNTSTVDDWLFWLNALVQHYGPGTEFLDVTYSIDVALWFALHKSRRAPMRIVLGQGEQLDPVNDIAVDFNAYAYDLHDDAGYIYVFDVPLYNSDSPLAHGTMLDLGAAPKPFSDSARVRAQKACLLAALGETDFMPLVVGGKPLEVSANLPGAPSLSWPTEKVYPTPTVDSWYGDLLAFPIAPRWERGAASLTYTHPLRMPVYIPTDKSELPHYVEKTAAIAPLLYHPWVIAKRYGPASKWLVRNRLKNATRILLEGPLLRSMGDYDVRHWNDELLVNGPTRTVAFDPVTNKPSGSVDLRNVFIEFSVLETDWSNAMTPPGEDVLRAAWLTFDSRDIELWLFYQNPLTAQHRAIGAFPIHYDETSRELRLGGRRAGGENIDEFPSIALVARACLTLLRHLMSHPSVSPYPTMIADDDKVLVAVLRNACRLVGGKGLQGYYVATAAAKNPYMGLVGLTREDVVELLDLDVPQGFRAVRIVTTPK